MALVRKKLDDKILKTLRELVGVGGNKECFDCGQKGPTYINMTIGSFVCTSCSGILRGLTPPHRVKSISMATFTQEEIEFLKQNGNDNCGRTWLGLWDPKRAIKQEHRDFMIDKYERKRYYLEPASPLKSLPTNTSSSLTSLTAAKNANESLVPLKTPTLTPPATLRLHRHTSGSCNGLNATVSASSSSLGTTSQFQQQFTPDDSDFFGPPATVTADPPKILPPTPQKHPNLQRKNGIKMKKPAGGGELAGPTTYGRNQKNGLLNHSAAAAAAFAGSSGDINANKFTPDGDFVADFGSATIISTVGASNGGSHYGSASSLRNGGGGGPVVVGSVENGVYHNGVPANGEMENFADFDHNPIFNSAENMKSYFSSNSIDSNSTPTNSVSSSTASVQSLNGSDPFANFYSLTHTMANGGGGSANSAGSTVGTPTSGPLPSKHHHHHHGGYTCMSSPDENGAPKSAKVAGYGFPGETRFAASGYGGGNGTGYSHLQNYASVVVAQQQPECNRTLGSAANGSFLHQNNNNNDSTPLDNVQWNFWQQFGSNYWPPGAGRAGGDASFQQPQPPQQQQQYRNSNMMMSPQRATGQINYCSDPNRWSLPVNGSHVNGASNGNNIHNTTTPSIDRYAALKDLDEQFREIKLEAESNNNNNNNHGTLNALKASAGTNASDPHTHAPANPFKTANPFQQSQAANAWPIAAPTNGSPVIVDPRHQPTNGTNGGFYATSPYQGGFVQPGSASHLFNGNVSASPGVTPVAAYHHPAAYHQNGNGYAMVGTNGAMMVNGGGGPQVLSNVPVHHFGNFGNPFMAAGTTAGHSNNPFL
ncbi:arf-GAP domain and FG repeat-containing protein 1 [Anopheles cruzii]|uniref:arf-GAP domain and FG repeat-containing protein 1 n=1 Tax=Anopheles cruzii TaxID=68878 RepID=UPI0022EC2972|nr:arf-GAP domain and FG repeat-containing protein 1 [Anopheles cruzii]